MCDKILPPHEPSLSLNQTRYSGRGFWLAGRRLFSSASLEGSAFATTALGVCLLFTTWAAAQLDTAHKLLLLCVVTPDAPLPRLQACAEHLQDSDDEGQPAGAGAGAGRAPLGRPAPFLFEGQLSGEGPAMAAANERSEAAAMELLQATLLSEFRMDGTASAETTGDAPEQPPTSGDGQAGGRGGRADPASAARIFAALRALAEARGEVSRRRFVPVCLAVLQASGGDTPPSLHAAGVCRARGGDCGLARGRRAARRPASSVKGAPPMRLRASAAAGCTRRVVSHQWATRTREFCWSR